MNIDEAKTKWCPFALSPIPSISNNGDRKGVETVANRTELGGPDGGCLCLADRCMAWISYTPERGRCGLTHIIPTESKP